jgi:murein L,D-transpeptidase YafK
MAFASVAVVSHLQPGAVDDPRSMRLDAIRQELSDRGMLLGDPIFIRIFKQSSELELWVKSGARYALYKTFPVCRWSGRLGPKLKEGDLQSPEGFYSVARDQMNPHSRYYLSFNLGFPNAYDLAQGRTGSFLMVHGDCVSIGCYAMTDEGIEEIWLIADEALKKGQARFDVHVFPFRLTPEALAAHQSSAWFDFWRTLKTGYDLFESTHLPPHASVVAALTSSGDPSLTFHTKTGRQNSVLARISILAGYGSRLWPSP